MGADTSETLARVARQHAERLNVLGYKAEAECMRDLAAANVRLERERDEAQSVCTAWHGVFGTIEAHLQDRIAMRDEADPQRYLDIIRFSVADVLRSSKQIVAARWADYARLSAERDATNAARLTAEGERDRLREALQKIADGDFDAYEEHVGAFMAEHAKAALTPAPEAPKDGE